MNPDLKPKSSPTRQLVSDIVELGELQLELLKADASDAAKNMLASLAIAVFAACLILAAAPVLLTAVAHWLTQQTELSMAASLASVSAVTAAIAGVLGASAYHLAKRGAKSLERSRGELQRNLAWLKSSLTSDDAGHPPRSAK
ncbi:phage holin family protein [Aeoliella sp. ICT_H6.2]|uniref:Phage holin family protein n=1 Tax=Aeoliella straminimaris TaxID=2954799 RepID=A0A9X2F533_9BACT|nr:phage holin family protein [Aeoliella straminimaris]MCO6042365.1 phage holin family protein [Aeoliella straminimaris]